MPASTRPTRGMHDPELYRKVVQRHPGRVRAVYVHDVSSPRRDDEVARIARTLRAEHDVPLLRMENTVRAAEHARDHGLITGDGVDEVRREVERQEGEEE